LAKASKRNPKEGTDRAGAIYRALRHAIIEQALEPGAKLPEDAIGANADDVLNEQHPHDAQREQDQPSAALGDVVSRGEPVAAAPHARTNHRRLETVRAGVASVALGNANLFPSRLTKVSHPPAASATVNIYTATIKKEKHIR
jgi:hypothetical protein